MIKINLLPFRAARKKENIRRQVSISLLSVAFLFCVIGYVFLQLNWEIADLRADKAKKEKDLAAYAATIKKIDKIKKELKETKAKLKIIQRLEKNKTGPVRLLDEISAAIPKDRLWLKSMDEKKGTLTMNGTAMDNGTVSVFMENLKNSEHINAVTLKSTKLKRLKKYKLNVTEFSLSCRTFSYEQKPKPSTGKGGKRSPRR